MTLYDPNFCADPEDAVASCHAAIEHGRQLALDDLRDHPEHGAENYAVAAANYVHATLMTNARKHLLAQVAGSPVMSKAPNLTFDHFVEHKRHLDELRDGLGWGRPVWSCWMQDIAVGIAQIADELLQANSDGRGYTGSPARDFVFQFVHAMPEHNYISLTTPVARPAGKQDQVAKQALVVEADEGVVEATSPGARPVDTRQPITPLVIGAETIVTTAGLIDQWLDAKGRLSRAERSRQGSSVRLFVEAMGLTEATADRLAEIGDKAAERFVRYADATPLAPRGERARIAHIKSFIAYAQSVPIAVPDQDWTHAHN